MVVGRTFRTVALIDVPVLFLAGSSRDLLHCPSFQSLHSKSWTDGKLVVAAFRVSHELGASVGLIRFTVTDGEGTASFSGPGHVIKMFVAACAKGPETLTELLNYTRRYDEAFVTGIVNGLRVFDEHNLHDNTESIEQRFSSSKPEEWPPFRVFNEKTRAASTQPGRAGLIVINLAAKRIIQVQNSYWEIQRADRGRIRAAGKPTRILYHYDLPREWALVP